MTPTMSNHGFEWLAKLEIRRSDSSNVGVGVAAIAR